MDIIVLFLILFYLFHFHKLSALFIRDIIDIIRLRGYQNARICLLFPPLRSFFPSSFIAFHCKFDALLGATSAPARGFWCRLESTGALLLQQQL